MSIRGLSGLKAFVACVMVLQLAGCGGGGGGVSGGGEPAPMPLPPVPSLPLMFDSLGRQVPEAEFGAGDPGAAGADGTAFDLGPLANAAVTLTDAGGAVRTATTDASGYYRLNIKGLTPPFIANVRRGAETQWFSASAAAVQPRRFVTINLSALTDKILGHVAEAANIATGVASAVTIPMLTANPAALVDARRRISAGLAAPLARAGLDAAGYDPVATPLAAAASDRHSVLLQSLRIITSAQGRTTLAWTAAGGDSALFNLPMGVAVDMAGNVLVADTQNNLVRKISPAGVVTTLAGTGQPGFTNGARTTATFDHPVSVALDAQGNVYVADAGNRAARKISANGMVTTLIVDNFASFSSAGSMAVDAAGNLYFVDRMSLRKITPDGVVRTIATSPNGFCCASRTAGDIFDPHAVALDAAGNIYVAATGAVVKITPAGVKSDLYLPAFTVNALAAAADTTVYATASLGGVWRITPDGAGSLLAGGTFGRADGTGTAARFNNPWGIALDGSGNLVVADPYNNTIRKVTVSGEVTTFAGKRPGFTDGANGSFGDPSQGSSGLTGVAAGPDGTIFVADSGNHSVRKIAPDGTVTTVAGNGFANFSDGNGRAAAFNTPNGIALDGAGNIYVSDSGNHVIRKVTAAGDVTTFAGSGVEGVADGEGKLASFSRPLSLVVGPGGDLYVAEAGMIRRVTATGVVSTIAPPGLSKQLEFLSFVTGKAGGPVYVALSTQLPCLEIGGCFTFETAIFSLSRDGAFGRVTGPVSRQPGYQSVAVDSLGNLYYLVDKPEGRIVVRLTPAGVKTELPGIDGLFKESNPITAYGDGLLVIADRKNAVVQIVML